MEMMLRTKLMGWKDRDGYFGIFAMSALLLTGASPFYPLNLLPI